MTEKKPKKREAPISYRLPKALRPEFYSRVKRSGLSTSAFLTKSWYGDVLPRQVRRPPVEEVFLAKMLASIAQTNDLIRKSQITDDHGEQSITIAQAKEELRLIRTALFKLLERKP